MAAALDMAETLFFEKLQPLVQRRHLGMPKERQLVCGVDAAYCDSGKRVVATAVLFDGKHLKEHSTYCGTFTFPYMRGLFYLHEGPFVVAAVERLKSKPELVCFDAHGRTHPRRAGMASVCGTVLGIPSIGIAKSLLIGTVEEYQYGLAKIKLDDKIAGFQTTDSSRRKKYWSPGFAISIQELKQLILSKKDICLNVLSQAHRMSKEALAC